MGLKQLRPIRSHAAVAPFTPGNPPALAKPDHGVKMCVDVCVDVCVDMCVVMCVDMCVDVCVAVCVDVCVDTCVDACVDVCVDMGVDMDAFVIQPTSIVILCLPAESSFGDTNHKEDKAEPKSQRAQDNVRVKKNGHTIP